MGPVTAKLEDTAAHVSATESEKDSVCHFVVWGMAALSPDIPQKNGCFSVDLNNQNNNLV